MFVIAKHHDVLRELGLDSMDGVKRFQGEPIKNHKGQRDIQRIVVERAQRAASVPLANPTLVLYLKRNWRPYKKDGLKSLFSRGQVWSQSRTEWENSRALLDAGVQVADLIAFGEECGLLWEKFSFIITAAAAGSMTVDHFLRTSSDRVARPRVFDALARTVRKMHDAGLASPDLFTRHIFVEPITAEFCLIDMARIDRRPTLSLKLRARDLAALNVTAPLRFISTRERLRFLGVYGGSKELRGLIQKRTAHLLERRKFAEFGAR